jgi:Tfp pilus assembly protein PilN
MTSSTQKQSLISRPELQFWMPIIVMVVGIASSFFYFGTRIALLEQQVQQTNLLIAQQSQKLESEFSLITQIENRVVRLETVEGIKN